MKTIVLSCTVCSKEFERRAAEHKRNLKKGRRVYCSLSCCSKDNLDNIPKSKRHHPENLDPTNRADEFSPFRWHFRNCKRRNKEFNLTLEYLKELWEKQKGRCPYTGWKLKNMSNLSIVNQLPLTPDRASLDRIDSSKGYVKGNVQFVSYMAQCAKHEFKEDQMIEFCDMVSEMKARTLKHTNYLLRKLNEAPHVFNVLYTNEHGIVVEVRKSGRRYFLVHMGSQVERCYPDNVEERYEGCQPVVAIGKFGDAPLEEIIENADQGKCNGFCETDVPITRVIEEIFRKEYGVQNFGVYV